MIFQNLGIFFDPPCLFTWQGFAGEHVVAVARPLWVAAFPCIALPVMLNREVF